MSTSPNKIGISMRMVGSDYGEWRDALSHDLIDYVHHQGFEPVLIPNRPEICTEYIRDVAMLILSGGDNIILKSESDTSDDPRADRDRSEWKLLRTAIEDGKPVLGICRGLQFINTYYEGTCAEVASPKSHVAVDHEIQLTSELLRSLLGNQKQMTVNSFHGLGIKTLGKELIGSAVANDGGIEAVEHTKLPILGLMWHPERKCSDAGFVDTHADLLHRVIAHFTHK